MSLQPEWYSTIWGVYALRSISVLARGILIITIMVMKKGLVRGLVSDDHLHDLGKYVKRLPYSLLTLALVSFS